MAAMWRYHDDELIGVRQNSQLLTRTLEPPGPQINWIVIGTTVALWTVIFIFGAVCMVRKVKAICIERRSAVEASSVTQA